MTKAIFSLIFLLIGCQGGPNEPKKPDLSPRVPVNKTIPPIMTEKY